MEIDKIIVSNFNSDEFGEISPTAFEQINGAQAAVSNSVL